jgi:DNA recombination protein RmuC
VKTEFGKFGSVLDRVQRQLMTATRTIEETGTRTRAMERKLRAVQEMDAKESATILSLPVASSVADGEGEEATGVEDADVPGAA